MIKTTAHAEVREATSELVAENLRDFMKKDRWTGRSFALAFGLQPVYVQRRMSGEVEMSASDLRLFADSLGVKVQDFFIHHETTARPGGGAGRRNIYLMDSVGPAVLETATSTVESGRFAPDWVAPVIPMRRAS